MNKITYLCLQKDKHGIFLFAHEGAKDLGGFSLMTLSDFNRECCMSEKGSGVSYVRVRIDIAQLAIDVEAQSKQRALRRKGPKKAKRKG